MLLGKSNHFKTHLPWWKEIVYFVACFSHKAWQCFSLVSLRDSGPLTTSPQTRVKQEYLKLEDTHTHHFLLHTWAMINPLRTRGCCIF